MKTIKTFVLILCSSLTTGLYAQESHDSNAAKIHPANKIVMSTTDGYTIPPEVQSDFDSRFPNTEINSLQNTDNGYEIGFIKNNKNYSTFYDSQNNWISSSEEINYDELPALAKNSFKGSNFSNYKVKKVKKVQKKDTPVYYEMNLENAGTSRNLYFDEAGSLLEDWTETTSKSNK